MTSLTPDERFALITRNLQETIGGDELREICNTRAPRVYWGTATTGAPHVAYLLPLCKIRDFVAAGCEVVILLADLHAMLDAQKSTAAQLQVRTQYYRTLIASTLTRLGVDMSKITWVVGSTFQLTPEYMMDILRANAHLSVAQCVHAAADVVKLSARNPNMNGLLYPTLQALDLEYLKCDVFFGGVDQRKINVHTRELLPKLGYRRGIFLMNEMIPALSRVAVSPVEIATEGHLTIIKMSSSDTATKLDLLDDSKTIVRKINKVWCESSNVNDNTLLHLCHKCIWPVLQCLNKSFTINRGPEHGGPLEYKEYEDLVVDFVFGRCTPQDLKQGMCESINWILDPIRVSFHDAAGVALITAAYPDK